MRLNTRETRLLWAAGIIILASLLYVLAIEPSVKKWQHEGVLIEERVKTIKALKQELESEEETNAKYSAAMSRMTEDRKRDMNPRKLFSEIEEIAAPTGAKLRSVDPLPVEKHSYYDTISVRIVVESDIYALVRLLDSFSKETAGLDMDRVTVSAVEPGKPTLSTQVQLSTTMLHEKEKVAR